MMKPQDEILKSIEDLILMRLDLLKLYPVLSVNAMQCLEKNDMEGLGKKLDERSALIGKMDMIGIEINTLAQLDGSYGAVIADLMKPGIQNKDCPEWGAKVIRSMERTYKLLQSCAFFDEKLIVCAKAVHMEIESQLGRIRAQRKINSLYTDQNATPNSAHILSSTK